MSQIRWDTLYNNCGVHVIAWANAVVTNSHYPFSENNMTAARKGIACSLWNTKNILLGAISAISIAESAYIHSLCLWVCHAILCHAYSPNGLTDFKKLFFVRFLPR